MGNGTSIGRVRGLGSAKAGAHHWLIQRFTAIGNLVLGAYLAVSFILLPDFTHATVSDWMSGTIPSIALALFVISSFWHARLGLQVLVEDYIKDDGTKFGVLAILNLLAFGGGAFGLFSILRITLGGAI